MVSFLIMCGMSKFFITTELKLMRFNRFYILNIFVTQLVLVIIKYRSSYFFN